MALLISVVICTFNRAQLLADVLRTLQEQVLPPNEFEIIIVDNMSIDNTKDIVLDYVQTQPNLRYCVEEKIGLSHARNRGWQEAIGEYIAYTDDDVKLPSLWLATAKEIIAQISPDVFGGPYYPFYNELKPIWFKDSYGSRILRAEAGILSHGEHLSGGNIFIRRSLLKLINGFPTQLGMAGHKIAYGEETAVQMYIQEKLPDQIIYYDPRLYIYHLVRLEKMTFYWLLRAFFAKGQYVYLTAYKDTIPSIKRLYLFCKAANALFMLSFDLTIGTFARDKRLYPYRQNYFYEHTSAYLRTLGRLYAQYIQLTQSCSPTLNTSESVSQ